jgi:hypothetical protein
MDHDVIVGQLLDRCKSLIENILQAPDLYSAATASLAIFARLRDVVRKILQAKIALEAQQRRNQTVAPCCPEASVQYVQILVANSWERIQPTWAFCYDRTSRWLS